MSLLPTGTPASSNELEPPFPSASTLPSIAAYFSVQFAVAAVYAQAHTAMASAIVKTLSSASLNEASTMPIQRSASCGMGGLCEMKVADLERLICKRCGKDFAQGETWLMDRVELD